ncbi:LysE/ArgO family amino acid transporter [Naumannella halotolerans]|uniref:L-lysine exporter family protein LysE/ArgO n=1 Tax=Naumannella halotolerans TaxID=993414 RepID=A0A4V3EMQ2_9ACTN|nr:LysE/ArgO family amino acid transporter [Naumannella halotolerans]TDT30918.1 L-lysine exporter family protein LysE/ArgO [Naumannella halotolerans]
MTALTTGLLTGWAMIIAIGAQNAFLLRQGLAKTHVGVLVAICILSDLVLILAATAGLGVVIGAHPVVMELVRWGGVAFLIGYALLSFRRALNPSALQASRPAGTTGPWSAAGRMLVLTWLNPHLFVDILVLGSLANSQGELGRWWFAVGAVLASTTWFALLGYGSALLRPMLARPGAWRVLDIGIGVVMLGIAAGLALSR